MFGTVAELERSVGSFEDALTRLLDITEIERHQDPTGAYRQRLAASLRRLRDALHDAFNRVIEAVETTTQAPQGLGCGLGED